MHTLTHALSPNSQTLFQTAPDVPARFTKTMLLNHIFDPHFIIPYLLFHV